GGLSRGSRVVQPVGCAPSTAIGARREPCIWWNSEQRTFRLRRSWAALDAQETSTTSSVPGRDTFACTWLILNEHFRTATFPPSPSKKLGVITPCSMATTELR